MRVFLQLLWLYSLLITGAEAATALQSLDIRTPRPFGYVIGDVIHHEIELALNKPYHLIADESFPAPGRISQWLEFDVSRIDHRETNNANYYAIVLSYQIINIVPGTEELATPEHKIRFSDDQGRLTAVIPAWRFRVAMLSAPGSPARDLQPDLKPPVPAEPAAYLFWLAVTGLLTALAGLLLTYGRLPFLKYHNGPFSRAYRRLQILKTQPWDDDHYRQALRTLHEAFNQTLNKTVFVDDLDNLFIQSPRFTMLRQPIEQYFRHSRSVFFNESAEKDAFQLYSLQALVDLCRKCRDIERGWR